MGSPAFAAWIAHVAFWVLLLGGLASGDLAKKHIAVFLTLWMAGRLGLPYVPYGAGLFSSYVAMLDIALVFIIFRGDVRLS